MEVVVIIGQAIIALQCYSSWPPPQPHIYEGTVRSNSGAELVKDREPFAWFPPRIIKVFLFAN